MRIFARFCVSLAAGLLSTAVAVAQTNAGKQVRFVVGADVGGGYDLMARTIAPYLARYLDGSPAVIVQNMPEAGSLAALNFLANTAPRDGTVFALIQRGMLLAPMTNPRGVRFNLKELTWIANLNSETSVVIARRQAAHKSAQDLFEKELVVGGQVGVDPEITAKMYNGLIGTKLKIINGYKGTNDIARAMETGEVEGIADWSWSTFKLQKADWLRDGKARVLMQATLSPEPDLSDVPNALTFAKDDVSRSAMELYLSQKTVARPIVAPPGLENEQARMLRSAFMRLEKDSDFMAAVKKARLELKITSGEDVTEIIRRISSAPQSVTDRLRGAIVSE